MQSGHAKKQEMLALLELWKKLAMVHSLATEAKAVGTIWKVEQIEGMLLENFQEVIRNTATRLLASPLGMWFNL